MFHYEKKGVAGLEVIHVPGDLNGDHICLLHGYGANAFDLAPFSQMMHVSGKPKANWYFPGAPLVIDLGMGHQGHAWFPIDFEVLENPSVRNYSQIEPSGLKEARERLITMLKDLRLNPATTILGGFSQGAMVTVDVMLHIKESFRALILFSGTLLNQDHWTKMAQDHAKTKFFQSHGASDPLLKIDEARKLYNLLKNASFEGDFIEFVGGHDIPHEVISQVVNFLSKI